MATDIRRLVAEKVKEAPETVVNGVVDELVGKEFSRRKQMLIAGLEEQTKLNRDLQKIKPDSVTFKEDGSEASCSYTKPKFEERKKLVDRIAKLDEAMEKAIGGDFQKLNDLVSKSAPSAEA